MNKIEIEDLVNLIQESDNVILIVEQDDEVNMAYNDGMDEMECLDLLALVTSQFYEVAQEGDGTTH